MALPFLDNYYLRPDTALGASYQVIAGTISVGHDGAGHGQTADPASGYAYAVYQTDQPASGQKSKITLPASTAFWVQGGPCLRMANTPGTVNCMLALVHGLGADWVGLYAVVNNAYIPVGAHFTENAGLGPNDSLELRVDAVQTYTLWKNSVQVGTAITDGNAYRSAGFAGFMQYSAAYVNFAADNNGSGIFPQALSGATAKASVVVPAGAFANPGPRTTYHVYGRYTSRRR
jgi:hypothetical protein